MANQLALNKITHILENDNHENRSRFKDLFKDDIFTPRFDISLNQERELALLRLKAIAKGKFISVNTNIIHFNCLGF